MSVGKKWVFTLNNPSNDEVPESWKGSDAHLRYCVWQRERGANGTPHLQGYVVFSQNKTLGVLKKLNSQAHWEVRKGTHAQAKAYVTKDETREAGPWTFGDEPASGQGGRSDLLSVKRKIDEGATMAAVADEHFATWTRLHRALGEYKAMKTQHNRSWPTFTTVYWGPPGTGKTRRAFHEAGPEAFWLMKPGEHQTPFFDGYDGHDVVVIDEFFGWLPRDLMCRMCDRYPCRVQTKGGSVSFYPKRIIITSNVHPSQWWSKIGLGPMERRLNGDLGKIVEMAEGLWQPPPVPIEEIPSVANASAQLELAAVEHLVNAPPDASLEEAVQVLQNYSVVQSPVASSSVRKRGLDMSPRIGHDEGCGCFDCYAKYRLERQLSELDEGSPASHYPAMRSAYDSDLDE